MRRDMDLVRGILLAIESASAPLDTLRIPGYDDPDLIRYHVDIMLQAGLIQVAEIDFRASASGVIMRWEGHDFLDNARDDSRWKTAKKAGSVSFDVLKSVLITLAGQAAKQALGLP